MYGISSYSQIAYSSLPARQIDINGIANGSSSSQTSVSGFEYKTLIAILNAGGIIRVHADKGGNIVFASINEDKNRIDFKVMQDGSIRDGYITNPDKFVYYKILKTQINS